MEAIDQTVAQGKRRAMRAMIAGVLGMIMALVALAQYGLEGTFSAMSLVAIMAGAIGSYSLQTSWKTWRLLCQLENDPKAVKVTTTATVNAKDLKVDDAFTVIDDQDKTIAELKRTVEQLRQQLEEARTYPIGDLTGALRLRETVLLYVGEEPSDALQQKFIEEFGFDVAQQAMRHLFYLENAPVSAVVREQMRAAFNHGMNRW